MANEEQQLAVTRSTVRVSRFKTQVVPPHCSNKRKNIAPRKSHQEWTPRKAVDKVSAPRALFDPTNYVLPLRVAITCSLVAVPHLPFAPFMLRPFTGSYIKGVGGSLCPGAAMCWRSASESTPIEASRSHGAYTVEFARQILEKGVEIISPLGLLPQSTIPTKPTLVSIVSPRKVQAHARNVTHLTCAGRRPL